MKTIIYFLTVAAATCFIGVHASAQYHHRDYDNRCDNNAQQTFYYYPQSNVYYSTNSGQYIYFDRNSWVVADRLPRHIRIRREPRFAVTHSGFDVWNDNRYHAMKYRNYRYGAPDVVYDRPGRFDNHRPDNGRSW